MTIFNALPYDIFCNIVDYLEPSVEDILAFEEVCQKSDFKLFDKYLWRRFIHKRFGFYDPDVGRSIRSHKCPREFYFRLRLIETFILESEGYAATHIYRFVGQIITYNECLAAERKLGRLFSQYLFTYLLRADIIRHRAFRRMCLRDIVIESRTGIDVCEVVPRLKHDHITIVGTVTECSSVIIDFDLGFGVDEGKFMKDVDFAVKEVFFQRFIKLCYYASFDTRNNWRAESCKNQTGNASMRWWGWGVGYDQFLRDLTPAIQAASQLKREFKDHPQRQDMSDWCLSERLENDVRKFCLGDLAGDGNLHNFIENLLDD